jgi:hypothetical protein
MILERRTEHKLDGRVFMPLWTDTYCTICAAIGTPTLAKECLVTGRILPVSPFTTATDKYDTCDNIRICNAMNVRRRI